MDELLVAVALVVGIALGATLCFADYASGIRRIARFLRNREPGSNARVTLGQPVPGLAELSDEVNATLDASASEHVASVRQQASFRRDLSALSHDVRTPLMGARGFVQLACDQEDRGERNRLLDEALIRLDDVSTLLDQLFSYAKASDPDLALARESVPAGAFVTDVLVGHYPEFEARLWEPDVAIEDDCPPVEADADALRRIVENLVSNALRHGSAAPSVRMCSVGQEVVLTISNAVDNPRLMDPDRLFERFYRADPSRGGQGSGLGLPIAAGLAAAMGMKLTARLDGDALSVELRMKTSHTMTAK